MTKKSKDEIKSVFSGTKITLAVAVGVITSFLFLYKDFNRGEILSVHWQKQAVFWMFCALILIVIRHTTYMYRIKLLSDHKLSWYRAFIVISLWEFASAITPTIIGGTAVAFFIVHKEGIKMGKTTAMVSITAMLDELFYIIIVPFVLLMVWGQELFPPESRYHFNHFNSIGAREIFLVGYAILFLITLVILYGIFINPHRLKKILFSASNQLRWLRRFRRKAIHTGNDIITTSKQLSKKGFVFWLKLYVATFLSWTARFLVVNVLIMAVSTTGNHLLIYARQLVLWVIMLVSPTPGGSGIAEFGFRTFMGDFTSDATNVSIVALLWRSLTYYPYLILGIIILPQWLSKVYKKKRA